MNVTTVGIDVAKGVFQVAGANKRGKILFNKKISRKALMEFMATLEVCTVAMEACASSHYWAREFQKLGHTVKLMPPQYVKPYRKYNKNDRADAEAICEAVQRPSMRFCSIKTVEQQDIQCLHRARSRLLKMRTALVNQIRGLMGEYGMALPKGLAAVRVALARDCSKLTPTAKEVIEQLLAELKGVDENVDVYNKKLEALAKHHPVSQRLSTIPGVGPIIATAILGAVGDASEFKNGRHFSAWLGLVPKHAGTGGKDRILGISKRGDKYLRMLLIHGSRSILCYAPGKKDRLSMWAARLLERKGWNKTAVAVANKNARTIWALLRYEQDYQVRLAA